MYSITPWQWLVVIQGFLAFIPAFVLLKHYRRTSMNDYLIFMGVFISVPFLTSSVILAGLTDKLIFHQLTFWMLSIIFLLLFLHAVRIVWVHTPRIIWFTGIIWFMILVLLITFWELMPQQPDRATVLFWKMSFTQYDHYPDGAGISTDSGIYIFTTQHAILFWLYGIFSACLVIYAYITTDLILPTKEIRKAKYILILAYIVFFIWMIIIILPLGFNLHYIDSLSFVTLFIMAYVSIFIPEAMLISHAQLLRVHELYKKVQSLENENEIEEFGMERLTEYLKLLPPEIFQKKNQPIRTS